jgi:hypothetical protein
MSEESETSCITLASIFCPTVAFLAPSVVCRVVKDLVYAYHPLFSAKAENLANRLGYHAFFVRANDTDGNPACRRGNDGVIRCVSLCLEFNSKES